MFYRTIVTVLLGLFSWFYGAWLHKNRIYDERHKSRFPKFLKMAFNLENKNIDRFGLALQFLAIWWLSGVMVTMEVVSTEEWSKVTFPVVFIGLYLILIFTNWGWWKK